MNYKLIVFLVITLFLGRNTLAFSSYAISYGDFINLSRQDQVKVIRMTHKFLVEYESRLIKEQKISKDLREKAQTYYKILDFFISSAYGNQGEKPTSIKCYYAGWISFVKKASDGNSYCVHPKRISLGANQNYLNEKYPHLKENYSNVSKSYNETIKSSKFKKIGINQDGSITFKEVSNCSARESIPCNPAVYGNNDGVILCSPSSGNYGVNASLQCDKALTELKDKSTDEFNVYLNNVIENLKSSNDSPAREIMQAMYDTCLCKGENNNVNPLYAQDVFPTRTCVSILSQTNYLVTAINNRCTETPSSFSSSDEFFNYIFKADETIETYIRQLRSAEIPNTSTQSANRELIEEIFESDQKIFKQQAESYYDIAKNAGLCPVGAGEVPKMSSSGSTESSEINDNNSLSVDSMAYLFHSGKLYSLLETELIINEENLTLENYHDKLLYAPKLDTSLFAEGDNKALITKTPAQESAFSASYIEDDKNITPQDFILSPPSINCSMEITSQEDLRILKIKLEGPKIDNLNLEDLNSSDNVAKKIRLANDLTITSTGQEVEFEKLEDKSLSYNIKNYQNTKDITINVEGSLSIPDISAPISCKQEITKETSPNALIDRCELSLKQTVNKEDGTYRFDAQVKFFEKDSSEELTKAPSDVKIEYVWFDHSVKASGLSNSSTERSGTEGVTEDLNLDDEEEQEEKKKTTSLDEMDRKYNELKDNFKPFVDDNDVIWQQDHIEGLMRLPIPRTISTFVTAKVNENLTCKMSKSKTIAPSKAQNLNSSPVLNPGVNPNVVRPRGNVLEMQR